MYSMFRSSRRLTGQIPALAPIPPIPKLGIPEPQTAIPQPQPPTPTLPPAIPQPPTSEPTSAELSSHISLSTNRKTIIDAIAQQLEYLFKKNWTKLLPAQPEQITAFHSVSIPSMTITDYLRQLARHLAVSESAFIGMLILFKRYPGTIDSLTMHRLLLTCLYLAHKITDDLVYKAPIFSTVGGISPRELTRIERTLMRSLDHHVSITLEEYADTFHSLLIANNALKAPDVLSIHSLFKPAQELDPPVLRCAIRVPQELQAKIAHIQNQSHQRRPCYPGE